MSIPIPLFPVLKPKLIDPTWFNVDQPCDDDNEITMMEQEHQNWVNCHLFPIFLLVINLLLFSSIRFHKWTAMLIQLEEMRLRYEIDMSPFCAVSFCFLLESRRGGGGWRWGRQWRRWWRVRKPWWRGRGWTRDGCATGTKFTRYQY